MRIISVVLLALFVHVISAQTFCRIPPYNGIWQQNMLMAYSEFRGEIYLYNEKYYQEMVSRVKYPGGSIFALNVQNRKWTTLFDPNSAKNKTASVPPDRDEGMLVYDELNDRLILTGSSLPGATNLDANADLTDTWSFDLQKRTWTLLMPTLLVKDSSSEFDLIESPVALFYHRGVQRPILIGTSNTFALDLATDKWVPFCVSPYGQLDAVGKPFTSGANYNDKTGSSYFYNAIFGVWGEMKLMENDLNVKPPLYRKKDIWKMTQITSKNGTIPSARSFFALYYDVDLEAMVITPGKLTNEDGSFTPKTGTYMMDLNTLSWKNVPSGYEVAANVYSVQQGPYRSAYFDSTFMLVVTYGSTTYLSVLQRVNKGICFTPYTGSALTAIQVCGFISMAIAAVLLILSVNGMIASCYFVKKHTLEHVRRDNVFNMLMTDIMTKFMISFNVFIMCTFYLLIVVPCYFVFGYVFPDYWFSTTKVSMINKFTHFQIYFQASTDVVEKSVMIYALTIPFTPLYILICYIIVTRLFYVPSSKELTERDSEFWEGWKTITKRPGGRFRLVLNYIFPFAPMVIMAGVAITYYFWIFPRINMWGYGEQVIQLLLFAIVRFLCNNIFAKLLFKNIYKPGTSWYELGIIELFASLDNQMIFILFIVPYAVLGLVSE
jgi:hypothetical protein